MEVVKKEPAKTNRVMVGNKDNTDMSKAITGSHSCEKWNVMLSRRDVINMIRGIKPSPKLLKEELDIFTTRIGSRLLWKKHFSDSITLNQLAGIYLKCR